MSALDPIAKVARASAKAARRGAPSERAADASEAAAYAVKTIELERMLTHAIRAFAKETER